jgi:hypothetical protein
VGAFLVTASAATVAVVAAALVVITGRPGATADPLAMALGQVSFGKAGASLVAARQQVIQEDAATESFSVTSAPKMSTMPPPPSAFVSAPLPDPGSAQAIAYGLLSAYGFSTDQWGCLDDLWQEESGWRYNAENASGAYGIPQALPGSKMASAGPDWQTDPTTQINWGLGYIQERYGSPCAAWDHEEADGWY